jgi:hypothetical protein
MGHVYVKNVGKLPAREVVVQVRMKVGDRVVALSEREDDFPLPSDTMVTDRAVLPGTEMRQGAAESDLVAVADLLPQTDRYVYVWGVVYYNDMYQRRFTRFRHRYPIASHASREDWGEPAREARTIIAVDKARFDPFGNSAN